MFRLAQAITHQSRRLHGREGGAMTPNIWGIRSNRQRYPSDSMVPSHGHVGFRLHAASQRCRSTSGRDRKMGGVNETPEAQTADSTEVTRARNGGG